MSKVNKEHLRTGLAELDAHTQEILTAIAAGRRRTTPGDLLSMQLLVGKAVRAALELADEAAVVECLQVWAEHIESGEYRHAVGYPDRPKRPEDGD